MSAQSAIDTRPPRLLLLGVGSIGGTLAGHLLARGHDLTLVTGNPAISAALAADGLTCDTLGAPIHVHAPAVASVDDIDPARRFDYVFLATMIGGVASAARAAAPRLAPGGCLVSMQNGVVDELVADAAGPVPLVLVSVAFGASMLAPGHYRMNSGGSMVVGRRDGGVDAHVETVAALLGAVVESRISHNILGVQWTKLAWNCAVSGLCAVAGCTLGELVATTRGQRLFLLVLREAVETARARSIALEPVVIDLDDYYLPVAAPAALATARMNLVARLALPYAAVRPSALQSLERGRPTEIPWLNGYLAAQAARAGVATPLNEALAGMVREIEAGRLAMGHANLERLDPILADRW